MDIKALIIISCICMLFVIGRIFIVPIKWILKLAFNSIIGGIIIWIINLIGGAWGFHIGLNIYTSLLVRSVRGSGSDCINIIKADSGIKINFSYNIKNKTDSIIAMESVWMVRTEAGCHHIPGEWS